MIRVIVRTPDGATVQRVRPPEQEHLWGFLLCFYECLLALGFDHSQIETAFSDVGELGIGYLLDRCHDLTNPQEDNHADNG